MKLNKNKISKQLGGAALIAGLVGLAQQPALAQNDGFFFGNDAPGKWTIGAKLANVDPNVARVKDANAAGIVLGYQFAKGIGSSGGSASVEFEYISADNARDIDGFDTFRNVIENGIDQTPDAQSYEANVANLFFTYRSAGSIFYKIKGGLSYANVDVRLVNGILVDREDVSLAGGVGIGYRINDMGLIEVEYSGDTGDAKLGILGVNALLQF